MAIFDTLSPTTDSQILNASYTTSANGLGFLRVSTLNSITTTGLSANQSISAVLLAGTANVGYVSAFVDNGSVSAKSSDAATFRVSAINSVSALSPDASLFRVSGIGTFTTTGLSANQSISAVLLAGTANIGYVSATIDNGSLSAKSGDANQVHVSAVQGDGSLLRVSSFGSVVTTNTGGASFAYSSAVSGATTLTVKSSAGRLYGYHLYNQAGVDQFLQIFNVSGGPSVGTDVPGMSLGVPTLGGAVMSLGDGIAFSNGIVVAATTTAAGATAAASAMRVNILYA